jgi:hypothetical protein
MEEFFCELEHIYGLMVLYYSLGVNNIWWPSWCITFYWELLYHYTAIIPKNGKSCEWNQSELSVLTLDEGIETHNRLLSSMSYFNKESSCFQFCTFLSCDKFFGVQYEFGSEFCNKVMCVLVMCQAVRLCIIRNNYEYNPNSVFVFT